MRVVLALILMAFFIACSPEQVNRVSKPENLLTKEVMIQLLTETQLIEAERAKNYLSSKDSLKEIKEAYGALFTKYDITQKDFEENLLYYYDFSDQMEEMLGESLNELTKMETELSSKEENK